MNVVYVVYTGEYEDRHVDSIWSTPEMAQNRVKILEGRGFRAVEIDDMPFDDLRLQTEL